MGQRERASELVLSGIPPCPWGGFSDNRADFSGRLGSWSRSSDSWRKQQPAAVLEWPRVRPSVIRDHLFLRLYHGMWNISPPHTPRLKHNTGPVSVFFCFVFFLLMISSSVEELERTELTHTGFLGHRELGRLMDAWASEAGLRPGSHWRQFGSCW